MTDMQPSMIQFSLLEGHKDLLAAAGKVAIAHGTLEYVLQMTVKSILRISGPEARYATQLLPMGALRKLVKQVSKSQKLNDKAGMELNALLRRAELATKKRNELMHVAWGETNSGPHIVDDDSKWKPAPPACQLEDLATEIWSVVGELNHARLEGFLKEAIDQAIGCALKIK